MSRNYGPAVNPGDTRERIWRIGGENPNPLAAPGAAPVLMFFEEQAIKLSAPMEDGSTERALGRTRDLSTAYNPGANVTIRNPATDVPGAVGRVPADLTQAECLVVLYSLGRQAQTDADALEE